MKAPATSGTVFTWTMTAVTVVVLLQVLFWVSHLLFPGARPGAYALLSIPAALAATALVHWWHGAGAPGRQPSGSEFTAAAGTGGAPSAFEAAVRALPWGVALVDESWRVVFANPAAAETLGQPRTELEGVSLGRFAPECLARAPVVGDGETAAPSQFETQVRVGNTEFACTFRVTPLPPARPGQPSAVVVIQDLRERKRTDAEIRRLDRLAAVGTMAASVAHEIKNPLVSVQTFVQLIPERYNDPEFRGAFAQLVLAEVARVKELVQNLLDFARPRSDKLTRVDMPYLIERVSSLMRTELRQKNIELVLDAGTSEARVVGVPELLHQVFLNLLRNAIEAMASASGQIRIAVTRESPAPGSQTAGGQVVVRLTDTGKGIPAADMPHLFEPFYTTKESGHGLGLTICRQILQELNASIRVESKEGVGTTVILSFPEAAGAAPEETRSLPCRAC